MGFPLIMYLSRSKTLRLWPALVNHAKHDSPLALDGVKSSVNLSLTPKIDMVAEWKRKKEDSEIAEPEDSYWPPHDSLRISTAIEQAVRERYGIGSLTEFSSQDFSHYCYKLAGNLFLDSDGPSTFRFGGLSLAVHGITGRIRLAGTELDVGISLSLESIAGISRKGDHWDVWESGAMHMLREATSPEGFPMFGLFTFEGAHPKYFATSSIVYFASAEVYRRYSSSSKDEELRILTTGVEVWPERLSRY